MARELSRRIENTFSKAALRMFMREFAFFDKVMGSFRVGVGVGGGSS